MKPDARLLYKDAAARLLAIRKTFKLTPSQMAGRLRITPSTYYKAERGENLFGIVTLKRLTLEFGISIDWLVYNHGPQYLSDKTKIDDLEKIYREMKQSCDDQIKTLNKAVALEREKNKRLTEPPEVPGGRYSPLVNEDIKELLEYFETDSSYFHEMMLHFKKHKENKAGK